MKLAILGTGNFGTVLGKALAPTHQIVYGSRTPEQKKDWATTIDTKVQVATYQQAVEDAEVVLLALNWSGNTVIETLKGIRSLKGKVLIDATNVLQPDYSPLKFEHSNSGAQEIKRHFPEANIVKAFNAASGFSISNQSLQFGDKTVTGFYCGDDENAKKIVAELLKDAGFNPLDAGSLVNATHLESLGQFMIALAFGQNLGVDIGWALLTR